MKRILCLLLAFVLLTGFVPPVQATDAGLTTAAEEGPYYGRNALGALENAQGLLYAYDRLAAGVAASEPTISVYDGVHPLTQAQIQTVIDAYRKDYVHHFWLGNSYRIASTSTSVVQILPSYILSGTALADAQAAMEAQVCAILSTVTDSMSEYEKALCLHDTLAGIVEYKSATNAHNAYGALVEGEAVCEGYAEALQYLMQRAGLHCFIAEGAGLDPVTGSAVAHAWNYVRIDGAYYHIDLTWDDQGDTLYHAYFGLTDTQIREDHAIDTTAYALPVCNSSDAFYFAGTDAYLDSYTVTQIASLLKRDALQTHVYVPGSADAFLSWYASNILDIAAQAGISGGFSYGYSTLGHEIVLRLKKICSHNYADGICLLCGSINAPSGANVRLSCDLDVDEILVPADVTLDLNGHRIAAGSVVSFGDIIDTAGNGCLSAKNPLLTENSYLPIYDSVAGGYRFFAFTMQNLGVQKQENGAVFGFAPVFTDTQAYMLLASEASPGMHVCATLSWDNSSQEFVFDTALLQQYAQLQLQYPQLPSALMLKVSGTQALSGGSAVTVTPGLEAGQLSYGSPEMTYLVD